MIGEIVTVGTELIIGKTVDMHSSYLSQKCIELGLDIIYHTSIGDDRERLLEILSLSSSRSNLVFLCGGLGPTMDDITKETVAEFLQISLVQNQEIVSQLHHFFANQSVAMTPNNLKQTYVFPTGKIFKNLNGTAPGLAVCKDKVTYILLPGPSRELIPMFEGAIFPYLKERCCHETITVIKDLSFFGIGEALLEDYLQDLIQNQFVNVALYVDLGVTIRLMAKARNDKIAKEWLTEMKEKILDRVGEYCYSENGETLEEVVISYLQKHQQTISFSESCTGGLVTHLLSRVPGSSKVLKGGWICYTDEVKKDVVKIPSEILKEYGAVSQQTALALAEQTMLQFRTNFALSVTGVAGPDTCEGRSVGHIDIALKEEGFPPVAYSLSLKGSRQCIQMLAAKHALFIIQQRLRER